MSHWAWILSSEELRRRLPDEYRVKVPIISWGGRQFALWGGVDAGVQYAGGRGGAGDGTHSADCVAPPQNSPEQRISRNLKPRTQGAVAQRKPPCTQPTVGFSWPRLEVLNHDESVLQEPPRTTRWTPVAGPVGLLAGLRA